MSFLKIGMNTIWSFILFRELQILSEGLYYQLQKAIEQRDDYVEVNRNIVSSVRRIYAIFVEKRNSWNLKKGLFLYSRKYHLIFQIII